MRLKNYLIDLFKQTEYEEVNISELKRALIFTAVNESKIQVRHYEINSGKLINETDAKNKSITMNEIGPHFDLEFRRDKLADHDLFKTACKQPKLENLEKKKYRKNLFTDEFGQQRGKVFLQHQDIDTLVTRKFDRKKGKQEKKVEAQEV